jgi:hypothetical protein
VIWRYVVAERHRFDPGGFVAGLYFIAVAVVFVINVLADRTVVSFVYLGPALLIGYALVLLIRVLTRSRRRA